MFGLSLEFSTQHRVLGCNTDGTCVEMAFAHHDAAFGNQGRCCKAKFISPQKRSDHHITPGFHLSIGLNRDSPAQTIKHQRLLGLGKAKLPGRTSVFDRGQRRCTCTAIMSGNHDMIRFSLSNPRGNRTDTDFGYQLNANACARIGVF